MKIIKLFFWVTVFNILGRLSVSLTEGTFITEFSCGWIFGVACLGFIVWKDQIKKSRETN